jgi:uncharacterized alpha-E superfamily protein
VLSRVAEALFWVGRYVERAEDTARLLDVHFHQVLEDPEVDERAACMALTTVMGFGESGVESTREVLELLAYDATSPSAIIGSLSAARQNARGVRESLSSEIWETLNTTFQELAVRVETARGFGPAPFFSYVRDRAATLAGYAQSTMSRDHGYDFLVLGRSVERVDMTARLLSARLSSTGSHDEWISTLRACSAHEAYLRTYQRGVEPQLVLEFLLLDRLFPRSVFAALVEGDQALARLDPEQGRGGLAGEARLVLGRARTDLEFLPVSLLLDGLPRRLRELQSAMSRVSEAVSRRFFAGSTVVEWALEEAWP